MQKKLILVIIGSLFFFVSQVKAESTGRSTNKAGAVVGRVQAKRTAAPVLVRGSTSDQEPELRYLIVKYVRHVMNDGSHINGEPIAPYENVLGTDESITSKYRSEPGMYLLNPISGESQRIWYQRQFGGGGLMLWIDPNTNLVYYEESQTYPKAQKVIGFLDSKKGLDNINKYLLELGETLKMTKENTSHSFPSSVRPSWGKVVLIYDLFHPKKDESFVVGFDFSEISTRFSSANRCDEVLKN